MLETFRGHSKSTFVEDGKGGVIEKRTKGNRGMGVLAFVYVRFFKKNAEIFKMKFFFILQFFLLSIMKIDFSARFYFAQIFVLFSALSIIFFAHFQQKWPFIH